MSELRPKVIVALLYTNNSHEKTKIFSCGTISLIDDSLKLLKALICNFWRDQKMFSDIYIFWAQILETSIKELTNLPLPEISPLLVWIEHKFLIERNASAIFLQDFTLKDIESTLVTPVKYT